MRPLAAFAFLVLATIAQAAPVPGEFARSEKAAPIPVLRIASARAAAHELRLPEVRAEELAPLRATAMDSRAKRVQIGIGRDLAGAEGEAPTAASLRWVEVPGGRAARFTITSPGAAALRVSIDLSRAPANAELVFFGSANPTRLVGPERVERVSDRSVAWWSPVTEGESQTAEVFVPEGAAPSSTGLAVSAVAHLVISPRDPLAKAAAKIGESGSCNIDANCVENPSQAYLDAKSAVARMQFVVNGTPFLCTGTLLNDTNPASQVPWFISANHCFDAPQAPYRSLAQKQQVANTLNTFWFYESSACGVNALSQAMVQVTGGASIVVADLESDLLFVRLNGTPPAGAFFAGWDPATLPAGIDVIGLHHPLGDLKKVSQGRSTGYLTPTTLLPNPSLDGFIRVQWSRGTTEGGSSGSGLFVFDASLGQYLYRGGLLGGEAFCHTPDGPDYYSRLDYTFPVLASSLAPGVAPSGNISALWWDPAQSGWGVKLMQHASGKVFGLWFTYRPDGKPMWYSMPDGAWITPTTYTGPLYEVSGPPPTGPFNAAFVDVRLVGSATASFTGANAGTWTWNVKGVTGAKAISRFAF